MLEYGILTVKSACVIVKKHFAIRPMFTLDVDNPGKFVPTFALDHQETGKCLWTGGPFDPDELRSYVALAHSLSALGDWSGTDTSSHPVVCDEWLRTALDAARSGEVVDVHGLVIWEVE